MTEVIETVWIPTPDGTRLAARLWLPDSARDAPVPCILEYIPYRRCDLTRMRDGAMERSLHHDLGDGTATARFFLDGGVFGPVGRLRLDETGTEMSDISDRRYTIRANDPLSAVATMDPQGLFERGDWSVRIETMARRTATRHSFILDAKVDCWDGETLFHTVVWHHEIPRNAM